MGHTIAGETVRDITVANPGRKSTTIPAGTRVEVTHGADIEHLYITRADDMVYVEATAVAVL